MRFVVAGSRQNGPTCILGDPSPFVHLRLCIRRPERSATLASPPAEQPKRDEDYSTLEHAIKKPDSHRRVGHVSISDHFKCHPELLGAFRLQST